MSVVKLGYSLALLIAMGLTLPALAADEQRRMVDGSSVRLVGVFLGPRPDPAVRPGQSPRLVEALTIWTTHIDCDFLSRMNTRAVLVDGDGREFRLTYRSKGGTGPPPRIWDEEWVLTPPPPLGRPLRLRVFSEDKERDWVGFSLAYTEEWRARQLQGREVNSWMAEAVSRADIGVIRMLLGQGAHANVRDSSGFTPLMIAAYEGDLALAKTLLDYGAAQDARNNTGGTALSFAAFAGRMEMAELLISRGADPNLPDIGGRLTPLGWARQLKRQPMIALLRANGATK